MQIYRMHVWIQQGKERTGHVERVEPTMYVLACVKQIASGKLLKNRKVRLAFCDDQGGGMGGRRREYVYL